MLPLLKKKEAKAGGSAPAVLWHPDFRNKAVLPDTKTVRTKFFVHIMVISATSALALYVGFREFNLAALRSELAVVEQEIESNTKLNESATAAYKKFQAEEVRFKEAHGLIKEPFRFPDFLITLGDLLPPGVRVFQTDFRGVGKTIVIGGSVRGVDAASGDVASELVKKLQEEERLKPYFASITLTNLGRDPAKGNLIFEILFTFKPIPKTAAKR